MTGISLVAVDLDGTLLTSQRAPALEGARLLKQAARGGIRVILATTRNPGSVRSFCRSLEIDDPMICTNGAQVRGSPDGPVWAYHAIPKEAALAIAQWADVQGWELSTTVGPVTYWRQRPGQALGPVAPDLTVVRTNADAIGDDPVRILVSQPEAIEGIRSLCRSRLAEQCYTETYYGPDGRAHSLGVFAWQANKGAALTLVLDRLNIEPGQAIAIGDNPNDLSMFACVQISIAMGNAPDEVKRRATIVAPTNDEEGVAWALQRFVLGGQ